MASKKEVADAIQERDWWRRVGKIVGATLHGWSHQHDATFVDPHIEVTGYLANVLLDQQKEIELLRAFIGTMPLGLKQYEGWAKQQDADAAEDRCRDCCSYSPGCGSEYDGICKHRGIPATTELGRPHQIWRHVYKHDSCEAFNEERTRHKAEAAGEVK